jgi:uncharacterized protein
MKNFIQVLGGGVIQSHVDWGATCLLLSLNGIKIVIDCGTRSWNPNNPLPDIQKLDGVHIHAIIFTHAHADHLGAGPVLTNRHPEAKIFMTAETSDLCEFQLVRQMRIAQRNGETHIFSEPECDNFLNKSLIANFKEWIKISDGDKEIEFCLWPSGHIRGAASVLVRSRNQNVVFSGDISHHQTPTVEAAPPLPDEFTGNKTIIVTGATSGDVEIPDRKREEQRLIEAVRIVQARKGNVLIPAFSIGRAQDVALTLAKAGIIVWLGGWGRLILDSEAFGPKFFHQNIRAMDREVDELLRTKRPRVVIATPGMMQWGQSQELARRWIGGEKNAVFIPGYQAPGTFGKKLLETGCNCAVEFEEPIPESIILKATVDRFAFSAHSDGPQLAKWIEPLNPKQVYVVHAQENAYSGLINFLRREGYRKKVIAARNGDKLCL